MKNISNLNLIGKTQKEGRLICEKNKLLVIIKRRGNQTFKWFNKADNIIYFELDNDIITNAYVD
jgi:hypothetical protein